VGHVPCHRAGLGAPLVRPGIVHGHGRRGPATKELIYTETGGSSGNATSRPWRPCAAAGTGWTGWHTPSWTGKTLDEDEAYAAAGISRDTAPATAARAAARLVTARTPPVRKKSSAERAGFHAPAGG
jgi:hypothetical protein